MGLRSPKDKYTGKLRFSIALFNLTCAAVRLLPTLSIVPSFPRDQNCYRLKPFRFSCVFLHLWVDQFAFNCASAQMLDLASGAVHPTCKAHYRGCTRLFGHHISLASVMLLAMSCRHLSYSCASVYAGTGFVQQQQCFASARMHSGCSEHCTGCSVYVLAVMHHNVATIDKAGEGHLPLTACHGGQYLVNCCRRAYPQSAGSSRGAFSADQAFISTSAAIRLCWTSLVTQDSGIRYSLIASFSVRIDR